MNQQVNMHKAFWTNIPLETVNGVPAVILSCNGPVGKQFIVQIGDNQVYNYTSDGKRSRTSVKGTGLDLRYKEAKLETPKSKKLWINVSVYTENRKEPLVVAYKHESREEAYKWAVGAKNVKVVAFPIEIPIKSSDIDSVTMYARNGEAITQERNVAMVSIDFVHQVHQSETYKGLNK